MLLCRRGTFFAFLCLKLRSFTDVHIETAKQKSGQQDGQSQEQTENVAHEEILVERMKIGSRNSG